MRILLIDNGTTLLEELKRLIPGGEIIHRYDDLSKINSNDFDLIILSGGSSFEIEGNEDKLAKEVEIIKNSNKPIIGICYGCELITKSFGGKLEKNSVFDKGIHEINIISKDIIFKNNKKIKIYESHSWKIAEIPEDFIILAKSKDSIEIIKHKEKEIYGFQFHPEHLVDKTEGDEIFLNLFNKIKNLTGN